MRNLLDQLGKLEKRLRSGVMLLMDYDGTLTPIVKRPELAVLSSDMKVLLKSMVEHFKIAIITGRSLEEVKKMVGLKGIYHAGNHGLEIEGPGVSYLRPEAEHFRHIISEICRMLQMRLEKIEGSIVENKGLTGSVHYRLVMRGHVGTMKEIFREVVKPYLTSGEVRVTRGKKVLEIRPSVDWDKGKAVLWILDVVDPRRKLIPIYLGDDRTDEDAFLVLKGKGLGVLVSEREKKTQAKFFLRDVDEVKSFLEKLKVIIK